MPYNSGLAHLLSAGDAPIWGVEGVLRPSQKPTDTQLSPSAPLTVGAPGGLPSLVGKWTWGD